MVDITGLLEINNISFLFRKYCWIFVILLVLGIKWLWNNQYSVFFGLIFK
jgi:hypothetical protein